VVDSEIPNVVGCIQFVSQGKDKSMAMRNITEDLQDRLTDIKAEREKLQLRLEELDRAESGIQILLKQEEGRWKALQDSQPSLFAAHHHASGNGSARSPLTKLLLEALSDGTPKNTVTLSRIAVERGYPFGEKNPRKSVHFAMVALSNGDMVRKSKPDQLWRLVTKQKGDA
jgi:hypothetical protein